ncbi:hypothetical protein [Bacillus licheniformis]|uniref:hypothetical protein n=1 Tax=Bacillus licheniformis TaxID=1402 RepID=UPI000C75938E|nr:hypothetical protein [Bacillus licheniformis]PLS10617.1 hypothetical protein CWM45_20475 [Bacillus licheniformis]
MFKAKSITFNSETYMLGQKYKPPGFTKMATVTNIVDNRNAFLHNDGGFEVRFDSRGFLTDLFKRCCHPLGTDGG